MKEPLPPVQPERWWRVGMVWLVIAGPAAVVVAGTVTAAIAIRGADDVMVPVKEAPSSAQAPAVQARNHAASPQR